MCEMNIEVFEKYESEVRSYCRNFPVVFKEAKGAILKDVAGKEYIDFFCGAGALNYGHNNEYIKNKLIDYLVQDNIIHSLDMMTVAKAEFIKYFEENVIIPRGFGYKIMFPGPTGTNGVESALKLARKYKQRQGIWCLMGGFHGMTLGALSVTSDRTSRMASGIPFIGVTHIPVPYAWSGDTIEYMNMLLQDDHSGVEKPAALIIETVQAEGGIYVFEKEWLEAAYNFCVKNDILFIVDDIQVGAARTGTFFSFERAKIFPDIVIMSKSIGGYGLPFAVVLFKPELDIWKPGEHNGTFRGNQLAMVAAKAGLEYMLQNNIEEEVKRKEKIIREFLTENLKDVDYDIRGIGMIWGIEMKNGEDAHEVMTKCFERGLILERAGRDNAVLKIMPPLTISDDLLIIGLEKLVKAIKDFIKC